MIVFHKHQYLWISFNCCSCKILKKKRGRNHSTLCWKKSLILFFMWRKKIANLLVKNSRRKLQKQIICLWISIRKSVPSSQKQQQQKNQLKWKTLISKVYSLPHFPKPRTVLACISFYPSTRTTPQPHLTSHLEENVFDKFIFKLSECIVTVI